MNPEPRPRPQVSMHVNPHEDEKHLIDYLRVLYKRRWVAIPTFLVIVVVGVINTYRTTPIYEAHAQILIEKDTPRVAGLNDMFTQQDGWYNDEFYQTQYRILQSRSLARRAVKTMRLGEHPAYKRIIATPPPVTLTGGAEAAYSAVKTAIVGAAPTTERREVIPQPTASGETAQEAPLVDSFLGALTVVPVRNSRLVELRFTSSEPQLAADMANALAKTYIEQNLEFKFNSSKVATDWLAAQMAEQRKKVEDSEAQLQRYKEQHDAVAVEDRQNIVVQRLGEMNAVVTKAKTARIEREALYNQLKAMQTSGSIDSFPAVLANDYVQKIKSDLGDLQRQQAQLADKYGDRHPEMVKIRTAIQSTEAKLKNELDKVVASVRSEYEAARAQEISLAGALDSQKGEALSLNRKGIEYSVLHREAESNRQIYESLMQRTKETGISGEFKASTIRVVDAAEVPKSPFLPRRERDISLAALTGLLFAVGLVFFFEYLDNRIKSPQELRATLNVPFLGMVPSAPDQHQALITDGVPANFAESIRSIRTNVLFSSAEEGAHIVVVTSAGPGEGKSVVSSNLAVSLAQAGQRVLLIDADMRRPRVHEIFDLPQEPGLSNLLVGDCKPSEAVRKWKAVPGLCVLSAGMIPPNPAELLGSKRFEEYISTLGEHFDWVLVDSPPVLAVADAAVVANGASGVVFVVGADQTSRQAAREAIHQLQSAHARVIGAVLNRVDLERNPYYYAHYYRKEYAKYYAKAPTRT
jgi:succinoglycan biosynthesis transport protein ExoP